MTQPPSPTPEDKVSIWVGLLKGLTLSNVLVIALLVIIAIPAYTIWRALHDEKLLDRLLSKYEEKPDQSGCLIRHIQQRAGINQWAISSGFAFMGGDRYFVSVFLTHAPNKEEIESYCETLKLLADQMRVDSSDRGDRLAR